jgi:hypothetical protein
MISVDEIALVKERVEESSQQQPLSVVGVASLRQLELLFLVAHDEVQRLETFESRARLVAERWELVSASKQIATNELPAGFSSVVTSNDRTRCLKALEILYGPSHEEVISIIAKMNESISNNNKNNQNATTLENVSPVKKIATPKKKRNPQVYIDDEFSYDDVANPAGPAASSSSPSSSSPVGSHRYQENNIINENGSSSPSFFSSSPSKNQLPPHPQLSKNNNNNYNFTPSSYLDTLACCKFISSLPKVCFELVFHREGEYASVALAAALDELKLFESQLRSSQESFENIHMCWNHELKTLSRESGVDLFDARIKAVVEFENQQQQEQEQYTIENEEQQTIAHNENYQNNNNQNQKPTSKNNTDDSGVGCVTASLDQLTVVETSDRKSWLAPPLLPLRRNFTASSEELFAGYSGPSLLGNSNNHYSQSNNNQILPRSVIFGNISKFATKNLESEESTRRAEVVDEFRQEFSDLLLFRSCEAEMMWRKVMYEKTAVNLRLLESKEEARKLRNQVNAVGFETL